jgi:hypothetical protein
MSNGRVDILVAIIGWPQCELCGFGDEFAVSFATIRAASATPMVCDPAR